MSMQKMMGELHKELANKLLEVVRDPEAKAGDLNVARQFLKDNEITALPADSNVMREILEGLPFDENVDQIQ
ncbi:MAG: hypothetical protein CMF58_06640 [Lentimicrobiaceae bacterium]|nr:hypothetical protein [Lentimicrobiaceae bacterium]